LDDRNYIPSMGWLDGWIDKNDIPFAIAILPLFIASPTTGKGKANIAVRDGADQRLTWCDI
jgi:hypothetical protein